MVDNFINNNLSSKKLTNKKYVESRQKQQNFKKVHSVFLFIIKGAMLI